MTHRNPRTQGLLVLNLALAGVIAWCGAARLAGAQPNAGRNRGEYTMNAGRTTAGGAHVVYVIDSANQEMIVLRWDQTRQAMTGTGYRNLAQDGQAQPGR